MAEIFVVGLRVSERVLAVVRWGVRLLERHHLWRRINVGHGAHAWRRGCPFQAVIPRAGGIAQGILIAQEVVDGIWVTPRHAHDCDAGWYPWVALRASRA